MTIKYRANRINNCLKAYKKLKTVNPRRAKALLTEAKMHSVKLLREVLQTDSEMRV